MDIETPKNTVPLDASDLSSQVLPDVSVESRPELRLPLHRVGMRGIEVPLRVIVQGEEFRLPAKAEAFVSLDKLDSKGIHMSRLFLEVQQRFEERVLNFDLMSEVTEAFLKSHLGLSAEAELGLSFELPVRRKALVSDQKAWRHYPVALNLTRGKRGRRLKMEFEVTYSSTCPCSSALARQLQQNQFLEDFGGSTEAIALKDVHRWLGKKDSLGGVAHAQRSRAQVSLEFSEGQALDILKYIDLVEAALGTPVQAAVKREDEQEFARLNAQNLMFCEDAGRKIKACLEAQDELLDFWAQVSHEESLHPHDAVAIIRK